MYFLDWKKSGEKNKIGGFLHAGSDRGAAF